MTDPREIEAGDHVTISEEPFDGERLRVEDTGTANLGITEIYVVALVLGCDTYTLAHAEGSREVTVEHEGEDAEEYRIGIDAVSIE